MFWRRNKRNITVFYLKKKKKPFLELLLILCSCWNSNILIYTLITQPFTVISDLAWLKLIQDDINIGADMWENMLSDMCFQHRQISLRIHAVWSESLLFLFSPWRNFTSLLSKMCPVKILIRLHKCAGWSESSLSTCSKVCYLTLRLIQHRPKLFIQLVLLRSSLFKISSLWYSSVYKITAIQIGALPS